MNRHQSPASPGPGVDADGKPVVDPTRNVLDLVEAAARRQDDLRQMNADHTKAIAELRAWYDDRLRVAETARIDAIRAVDVGNVQRAAEVQAIQATTLASQVVTSAEALRTQVAAAASAAQVSLAAALVPIQEAIADLRRAQYEAQGVKAQTVEGSTSARGGALLVVSVASVGIALLSVASSIVLAVALR